MHNYIVLSSSLKKKKIYEKHFSTKLHVLVLEIGKFQNQLPFVIEKTQEYSEFNP